MTVKGIKHATEHFLKTLEEEKTLLIKFCRLGTLLLDLRITFLINYRSYVFFAKKLTE